MKFFNERISAWTAAVTFCAFSGVALGQNRVDTATHQLGKVDLRGKLQTPAAEAIPSLYKDEIEDVGPQFVLKTKPKPEWLEASLDVQMAGTSNVYLTEKGHIRSSVMVSSAQLAIAPKPWELGSGKVAFRTGYRHQKFSYATGSQKQPDLNDLDFDVSTFFTQGRYYFNDSWAATVGVDHNRLLNAASGQYDEFYSEVVPSVGVDGQYKVNDKSALTVSVSGAWHLTRTDPPTPRVNDRVDEAIVLAYIRQISPKLVVQPYYRVQFTEYLRNKGRKETLQSLGMSVSYTINNWASVRAFASYEARDSSSYIVQDYRKFDNGVGASFLIRF
jgi:hypothetical protein